MSISVVTQFVSRRRDWAGFAQREERLTIPTCIKIYDAANLDIDNTEEPLVLFLKLLLIKYLNRQDTVFIRPPGSPISMSLCG